MATCCELGHGFDEMPRGTYAILHYLRAFGHEVTFLDRKVAANPLRLYRRVAHICPDVVLAQHWSAVILGCLRRCGWVRCPVVHAWDDYYAEQTRIPTRLAWPFEVMGVQWMDHVTTVSRYNQHLAERWSVPCTFIPHGTHEPAHETATRLESVRMKVVYLGDQSSYKRVGDLVESVRGLACDLFMVGRPNPDLRRVAPGNVHFTGPVPAEEVQAVLAQADVLANPSDQDSNFKFFEYIRAGKPILGVKGRAEYAFRNGEDALLVDDLRAGLERLIREPDLRRRLAENVKKREWLTWEQAVRRLERVLLDVAGRGGGEGVTSDG